ncbi:hypothetical protein [Burkholderia thailandensis]|uniref:hypothetical protein n=1 Tax=Burkholderia thailandensis TaxID=57975 RepID=UPI00016A41A1|nr:hypothetical protein [Burkholderia thailandensis]AIP66326.1 hypothetical protein DR62_4469 [Burkholderia thailandensis]AOI55474.1 hypothetical protein WI24_27470 [Burkholderia thailandensis]UCR75713.1 hypothetical protein BtTXDOH_64 [Burkholderia phage phiBt-TXDOH]
MKAGLQIFDATGRLMLDGTTRCGRVMGMQRIQGGAAGGVSVDLSRGTPFWSFMPDWLFQHISMNAPVPIVQIGAGGVSWRYSTDGSSSYRTPVPGWLIYGVF